MLTSKEILKQIDNGKIKIEGLKERDFSKPNSIKLRMTDYVYLLDYKIYNDFNNPLEREVVLRQELETNNFRYLKPIKIPECGLEIEKNTLYIAKSSINIATNGYTPLVYGKALLSTKGFGIDTTNSFYSDNYNGFITMSIISQKRLVIYPNLEVGKLAFKSNLSEKEVDYGMLSGAEIDRKLKCGEIEITPSDLIKINPNSVNLTLNPIIERYTEDVLDLKGNNKKEEIKLHEEGFFLEPGECYVASTNEEIIVPGLIGELNGRSSGGRLGLQVHKAGLGDIGFEGRYHLGVGSLQRVMILPNMQICQLALYKPEGEIDRLYQGYLSNISGNIDVQYGEVHSQAVERVRSANKKI